jgi:ABC-type glutathione transport system ATPase component
MCGSFLQVRDLAVRFRHPNAPDHQALRNISFEMAPGEVVGLMGESGSGKSTTGLALLGLLPQQSAEVTGSIVLSGRELVGLSERDLRHIRGCDISIMFQEPEIALSPVLRVGDQIAEVVHAHRDWSWKRCRSEAMTVLDRVGLGRVERIYSAYPHQLSGGQRQRVVLAQALVCEPALLVADEPTASLDAQSQTSLLGLLRGLIDSEQTAVLLISHSPELQASLADRLLIMKDGTIVEEGAFANLYRNSPSPYIRSLLGSPQSAVNEAAKPDGLLWELIFQW